MTSAPPSPVEAQESPARNPAGRWLLLTLPVLAVMVLIGAGLVSRQRHSAPLPVIAQVPDFEFTHYDGSKVTRDHLLGAPWIADFIFTRCPAICPRMTAQMKHVADALGDNSPVRIASFSVDPEHDTMEVLANYAKAHGAGDGWYFLTGDKQAIHTLSREGFLLGVDDSPSDDSAAEDGAAEDGPILHSNRFVLVDDQSRIRGFYDPFDTVDLERLLKDVGSLELETSQ